MIVVVNNISKKEEIDFKERVRQLMIKQIQKKFYGASKSNLLNKSCDAPVHQQQFYSTIKLKP